MEKGVCDGIICLGERILHHVVNGIKNRNDNYDIPIGLIPSGNPSGLAKSISEESKEEFTQEVFALTAIKWQIKEIDLLEITMPSLNAPKYAVNSFSWGSLTDGM